MTESKGTKEMFTLPTEPPKPRRKATAMLYPLPEGKVQKKTPQELVENFALSHPPKITHMKDHTGTSYVSVVENASSFAVIPDIHGDAGRLLYFLLQPNLRSSVPLLRVLPGKESNVRVIERRTANAIHNVIDVPPNNVLKWLSENFELARQPGMQIVFLGDYIDRGGQNLEAIDIVRWMSAEAGEKGMNVHALCGNHERFFLRFIGESQGRSEDVISSIFTSDILGKSEWDIKFILRWREYAEHILPTYRSLFAHYAHDPRYFTEARKPDTSPWKLIVDLLKQDGYLDWIENLKAAVIIDNNMFTHAGPVLTARNPEALNLHFIRLFSRLENPWAPFTVFDGHLNGNIPYPLGASGDFSASYIMHWKDEVSHGDLARWMAGFGIDRLYVGHCASEHAEVHFSGRVILVDATLSSWYESGHDGAIIIVDPASELPAVLISDPKGIGLVTVPFHVGYSREMLLNNEIGRYADEVYGSVK